jgi:hypothetical protein
MKVLQKIAKLDIEVAKYLIKSGELPAMKDVDDRIKEAEDALNKKLRRMQTGLESKFIEALRKRGYLPTDDQEREQFIEELFGAAFGQMTDTIADASVGASDIGRTMAVEDYIEQGVKISYTTFSQRVLEELRDRAYVFSKDTFSRIKGDYAKTLAKGYMDGLGIDDIAETLRNDFAGLRDNRLKLIARVEVQGAQNIGINETMREFGTDYKQWLTVGDIRVRGNGKYDKADHVTLHGQVVKLDEKFSNGLMYPLDRSGPLAEIMNCRCRHRSFLPRKGELIVNTPYYPSQAIAAQPPADPLQPKDESELSKWQGAKDGKDIVSKIDYANAVDFMPSHEVNKLPPDQRYHKVEMAMKEQGFDGNPKVLKPEAFEEAMKKSNFYAERTYSAPDKITLDDYRNQLYGGKWYVDCSGGGAQYGKGMYCAASYNIETKTAMNGIKSEMEHYINVNKERGNNYSYVERITLDPSAKIIKHRNVREKYLENILDINNEAWNDALKGKVKELTKVISRYDSGDQSIYGPSSQYSNVASAFTGVAKELTKQNKAADWEKYFTDLLYKNKDIGTLAAEMGYDAVDAQEHGDSGSYTVILNRTKVILCEGGRKP